MSGLDCGEVDTGHAEHSANSNDMIFVVERFNQAAQEWCRTRAGTGRY